VQRSVFDGIAKTLPEADLPRGTQRRLPNGLPRKARAKFDFSDSNPWSVFPTNPPQMRDIHIRANAGGSKIEV